MKKVAILYIALGRYSVFWKEFFESCEEKLNPCEKHYFVWTNVPQSELAYGSEPNVTIIPAKKLGWPYDRLLRFQMFSDQEAELSKFDYVFFFNANFQFYNDVDLAEITPQEWHDGLIAGIHPNILTHDVSNPDKHGYERRPESTAYVPYGKGKHYVCGAFNGGTSAGFLKMCKTLAKNIQTDLDNNIVACVDDESHLNAYLIDKKFLVCGPAYGFQDRHLKRLRPRQRTMVKIISRSKDSPKYGGTRYLREETNRKIPNNFLTPVMKTIFRFCSMFVSSRKKRHKLRSYFG